MWKLLNNLGNEILLETKLKGLYIDSNEFILNATIKVQYSCAILASV